MESLRAPSLRRVQARGMDGIRKIKFGSQLAAGGDFVGFNATT